MPEIPKDVRPGKQKDPSGTYYSTKLSRLLFDECNVFLCLQGVIYVMAAWNIIFYTTASGSSPVTEFIDGLDDRAQAKVINTIRLLREYDVRLGGSHAKKLTGTDMWELRILGSDSIRVFYVAIERQCFLLLHGFKKKTFKTPVKELKLATSRLHEYRSRS